MLNQHPLLLLLRAAGDNNLRRCARSGFRLLLRAGPVSCFFCGLALLLASQIGVANAAAQQQAEKKKDAVEAEVPPAALIPVMLPIEGTADTRLIQMIGQVIDQMPADGPRPILILEFRVPEGESGGSSQFERSLAIARFLASDRLSRVRTVAYLPHSVSGHAVLIAAACEEIVIHPDAELGAAGLNEPDIDATMRQGYTEVASRRRTIPVPVILGMLDRSLAVYRVQTLDGVRYALQDDLEALQTAGTVSTVETIVQPGDLATFRGRELRLKYGFASHLAADRTELAAALQLPLTAVEEDPSLGGAWEAIRVELRGPINGKSIQWIMRSIQQRLDAESVNFICVSINSPGGSAIDSLQLAQMLAALAASEVRTVAYVEEQARADAALVALVCDQLVMKEGAILGGPGAEAMDQDQLEDLRTAVMALAEAKQRHWSPMMAMVNPELTIHRYTHELTGANVYLAPDEAGELPDADRWQRQEAVDTADGLSDREAQTMQLARFTVRDFSEFRQYYQLEETLEDVQPNWAHMLIEKLASPKLAGALLFIAWFALMTEFMSPGIGVAGFVSGLCFMLFFWANFLHGTAGWLEVLLFLAGAGCLAFELVVLPGFGVFGFGGILMVIASLVLASQTFVIPRNSYQFEQLPGSLFTVVAGGAGMFVALAVMRRYLSQAPIFRRLVLPPPEAEERAELERREAMADFSFLLHKRGVATTRLAPAGKAQFGDEVISVVSDGELIAPGTDVYVAEVRGHHVLVRTLES